MSGVHLVVSDAHSGLKAAVTQQFAGASWQRCRVHFMRNLQGAVASKHVPPVMAAVKTIFAHTDPVQVSAQWDQVVDTLGSSFPKVAALMETAKHDVLAFTAFPRAHWQKIWSNNPIELIRPSGPDQSLVVDSGQRSRRCRWSVRASATRWWRADSSSQPRSRASASRAWMSARCASSAPRNSGPVTKLSHVSQMLA